MTNKATVLTDDEGVSVEVGSWLDWWTIGTDGKGFWTSVKLENGRLKSARITPKQLRRIAKALKALADEVDPPAPKVEYYAVVGGGWSDDYYRISNDVVELVDDDGFWVGSCCASLEAIRNFWPERTVAKIRARDLPATAKAA